MRTCYAPGAAAKGRQLSCLLRRRPRHVLQTFNNHKKNRPCFPTLLVGWRTYYGTCTSSTSSWHPPTSTINPLLLLQLGTAAGLIYSCSHSYQQQQHILCEALSPQNEAEKSVSSSSSTSSCVDEEEEDEMIIDGYCAELMKDHEMVKLPFGGKSRPFLLDALQLHKTLVKEAIACFEGTIDCWNSDDPQIQSVLAGHPIVYTRRQRPRNKRRPLIHNPHMGVPFELLEKAADVLLEEPRVTKKHSALMRWLLPNDFQKLIIVNMLHVLTSILIDLMLTSSVSVHGGSYEMEWKFNPTKAHAYYQGLLPDDNENNDNENDKEAAKIRILIQDALEEIDFDVVDSLARQTLMSGEQYNSWIFSMIGQDLYSTAYKLMLIVFYMFNWDTECRMMGRSVQQRFIRPRKPKQ